MAYADEVAADSPLLWWKFDEETGTTAFDASGNGYHGTYSGAGLDQPSLIVDDSPTGRSTYLGFNAGVSAPRDAAFYTGTSGVIVAEWTIQSDIPPSTGTNVYLGTFWRGNIGAWTDWAVKVGHVAPYVQLSTAGGPAVQYGGSNVLDGRRHHIVATFDNANNVRTLHIDGMLRTISTDPFTGYYTGSSSMFLIVGDGGTNMDQLRCFVDEFALYDHVLTDDRIRAHWYTGSGGILYPSALDLGLTMGTAHVQVGQWVPATGLDLGLTLGLHALREPLRPKAVTDTDDVPGPLGKPAPGAIYPGAITSVTSVPGIVLAPPAAEMQPLRPASVSSLTIVPGPWIPTPAVPPDKNDPDPPPWQPIVVDVPVSVDYPDGEMLLNAAMTVPGVNRVVAADCHPETNAVGNGTFTRKGAVSAIDAVHRFTVAGKTVMTGIVHRTDDIEVDTGEEVAELQRMTVQSTASELDEIAVLPEFGAMDLERLGPPTQDVRVFDWTALGLGDWSGDGALYTPGTTPVPQMESSGVDILAADTPLGGPWNSAFPLPDVWPDNNAQWMNWISPRIPAPEGWALFRIATPKPPEGKVQFWLCAYDYAELWVDGVKLVTCDTPGKAEHIEIEGVRSDYHLLAIRLYTRGGAAGVMCTMVPVDATNRLYRMPPTMNSRSGWVTLPVHDAFIYTPGAVLNRLFYEARQRGNPIAKRWKLSFSNKNDSAGRAWDIPEWPIELDVGISYLEACNRLAESYIDWTESPGGYTLNAYRKGEGTGHGRSHPWTHVVDLSSRGKSREVRQ